MRATTCDPSTGTTETSSSDCSTGRSRAPRIRLTSQDLYDLAFTLGSLGALSDPEDAQVTA